MEKEGGSHGISHDHAGELVNEPEEIQTEPKQGGHRRTLSGNIMSKLSFLSGPRSPESPPRDEPMSPKRSTSRAMAVAVQQQKTRRRKGSLRKVALLGRGAQRDRKESKPIPLDSTQHSQYSNNTMLNPASPENIRPVNGLGLGISDETPRTSMDGLANRNNNTLLPPIKTLPMGANDHIVTSPTTATSPTLTYTSTTDEEDLLSIPSHNLPAAARGGPPSSGSDSYFPPGAGSTIRRRPSQKQKSPLSIGGLAASPLPLPDAEWDYSETEWWGWVILFVTWIVFVTGMGSCLGVWSWAWDVGETPYAPPELEDDPTLPIVGYYPALIILTSVMAWVWVVVAWVGMKYFRHAKISGD
ncbi:uncharacterized protein EAF01_003116 [Botrytis porri]|uniref:Uncharacterized protein n=1 Tax=Botrytis porri TaxID=87229 RepID=A0A4Z1KRN0_9HELO|nr:uncharacterized protein EAF01_003116 [Botrytis porri]KAF7909398.1 hypothetical protein EAF01_003116 [Botrytis porri]TGO87852.1 hypothetical protein BPOR_0199g00030 [Botrytis porri]